MKRLIIIMLIVNSSVYLVAADYPKGTQVTLTQDEPLYFADEVYRQGSRGESFTVYSHNTTTHKVYVLTRDKKGKQIALNIHETSLASSQELEERRPAFKGLRLGMTLTEVDSLTTTSLWEYQYFQSPIDLSKPNQTVFLGMMGGNGKKKTGDRNSFASIGRSGPPGEEQYYNWHQAFVTFHDNVVYKFTVYSFDYTADKIDSFVKPWLAVAKEGLRKKLGEPHKVFFDIEDLRITNFQSGFRVAVCDWVVDDQRIILEIGESDAKFNGSISYIDIPTEKRLEEVGRVKTDL